MRVLIIDDDEQVIRLARYALAQSRGIEVLSATSGREGVEVAHQTAVDLILLDVMMPQMDGPAVLSALRSHLETRRVPVVFLSAHDQIESLLNLGVAGVIRKPFDPARLSREILTCLKLDEEESGAAAIAVPTALRHNFLIATEERFETIDRSLDILLREPSNRERMSVVSSEFHRLAGAAASYGLAEISAVAQGIEKECAATTAVAGVPDAEMLDHWRGAVRAMRDVVSRTGATAGSEQPAIRRQATRVLCVDALPHFENDFHALACDRRLSFELVESASAASDTLARQVPDVLLIAADLPDGPALPFLRRLRAMPQGHRPTVVLGFRRHPRHAEVVEAEELGVEAIVDPRDIESTMARIRCLLDRRFGQSPRVLCCNLDPYVGSFTSVIESAGYKTRVSDNPVLIDSDLDAFEPDLILLGVGEHTENALRLVRQIGLQLDPNACPVVLITSTEQPALSIAAQRAGAAAVLRVPLSRALLLTTIENKVIRARAFKQIREQDVSTGCLRADWFQHRLQRRLDLLPPAGHLTVCAVEASLPSEPFLVSLTDHLRSRLRETDEIGRALDRLLIAMDGIDERDSTALLERLLEDFPEASGNPIRIGAASPARERSARSLIAEAVQVLQPVGGGVAQPSGMKTTDRQIPVTEGHCFSRQTDDTN